MKSKDAIQMFTTVIDSISEPTVITDKFKTNENFKFLNDNILNNNNNIYSENKTTTEENNENIPAESSKSYNNNESNSYSNKQQVASSSPQGVIDSIAEELTSARLQQSIILSEIVGKPRSKTRRKRRF